MPKTIFEKKNVLVTGGAGFIGSHLCDELVKKSKVICVDDFVTGSEGNIDHLLQNPNFEFIKHDLAEPLGFKKYRELAKFKIDFQGIQEIYHLACPTSPKDFEKNRISTVLANSAAMRNALDLAVKYKAKFMQFSSAVVYGSRDAQHPFVHETDLGIVDQLSPRACYDEGKRFAETMTNTYSEVHGLDAKIVRIFRTYGSRMELDGGHMLPDFILAALNNKPLEIYGDERFSTSLCHVSDIVAGVLKVMKSAYRKPVNLGSNEEHTLVDVAKTVISMTGSKSQISFKKPLLFMSPLPMPQITLAKEKFGWFPITRLEDGLKEIIDYFKAERVRVGS
ncbi:NAD-dependent dehydratase [bacterium]|nr:NAD-dependent dehydratase [bacterium]|tara:strand:+ start:702 stop:1709 length:1008 start_codon:yes stop_codon:yes gene_type:complete